MVEDMVRVAIGFDPREGIAASVLTFSMQRRSSVPVSIYYLSRTQLKKIFKRERGPKDSTDFSISRFLVPYLSGYRGWTLYMDCDMLVLDDIANLWSLRDEKFSVMVVKRKHEPKERVKFFDSEQTSYDKKNWSSLMLFNNKKCRGLTVDLVNRAPGLDLHQFKWLPSENEIGDIPPQWNYLVSVDKGETNPSILHYTIGGPYIKQYKDCEFSEEWFAEKKLMLKVGL